MNVGEGEEGAGDNSQDELKSGKQFRLSQENDKKTQ